MLRSFFIILFVFTALKLSAQNLYLAGGLGKSKISFKTIDGKNITTEKSIIDFNLLFEINSNKRVSIKTGLFIHPIEIEYGRWVTFGFGQQYNSISYNACFIDFPLLITYNILKKNRSPIIQLSAGPYLSHGLSGEVITVFAKAEQETGFPEDFRRNDLGLMFSAGINIRKWQLNSYYKKEFSNILKANDQLIESAYNSVLGFNLIRVINFSKIE
ncbi:MAG: outer membrane beta-barrel protein [Tenuifilaceae bacterium]